MATANLLKDCNLFHMPELVQGERIGLQTLSVKLGFGAAIA